jgi:antitoxin component HigA of HigAB toxin-antitoxin module
MNYPYITSAILAIKPDAEVSVSGDNINKINWVDGNPTNITNEQILAKQAELQTEYDALEWKRNRQKEYPDTIECVHALLDGGDTLTDLQAQRTAVKEKYSKG